MVVTLRGPADSSIGRSAPFTANHTARRNPSTSQIQLIIWFRLAKIRLTTSHGISGVLRYAVSSARIARDEPVPCREILSESGPLLRPLVARGMHPVTIRRRPAMARKRADGECGGHMKRLVVGTIAAAVLVLVPRTLMAQAKKKTTKSTAKPSLVV